MNVVFPNPLVLLHGFGASPFREQRSVPLSLVRPYHGSDTRNLEMKLLSAIKAAGKRTPQNVPACPEPSGADVKDTVPDVASPPDISHARETPRVEQAAASAPEDSTVQPFRQRKLRKTNDTEPFQQELQTQTSASETEESKVLLGDMTMHIADAVQVVPVGPLPIRTEVPFVTDTNTNRDEPRAGYIPATPFGRCEADAQDVPLADVTTTCVPATPPKSHKPVNNVERMRRLISLVAKAFGPHLQLPIKEVLLKINEEQSGFRFDVADLTKLDEANKIMLHEDLVFLVN